MRSRNRWFAGIAGAALALLAISSAFGYAGQVAASGTVTTPSGTLKCDTPLTVSVTFLDASGKPVTGNAVTWTISGASGDTVDSPTTTDASGVSSTTVTLSCVVGSRTVTATTGAFSTGAVLGLTSGGLPNTSTVPSSGSPSGLPIGTLAALLAILAGGGIMVRRLVLNPR